MEGAGVSFLPRHIAIIMDGNGRWAKLRAKMRLFGHSAGAESVRGVIKYCAEIGVEYLTLFTFSTENINRPRAEVDGLMELLVKSLRQEEASMIKNGIRLHAIGGLEMLPEYVVSELNSVIEKTKNNNKLVVTLAINYGAREEILRGVRRISASVKDGLLGISDIDEFVFSKNLYTSDIPDVDLLIRTSGELRLSNFMLWQCAYAELYFTDTLWPDFKESDLQLAIDDYSRRERRFGKTSEQLLDMKKDS